MKKMIFLFLTAIIFCSSKKEADWTNLLDKNLSHWDNYLSYRLPVGYNGQAPRDKDGNLIPPVA